MKSKAAVHKAVIPVGGLGTRLLPVTKVLPKEMLPVGRRPVIQYVVEEMRAARLEDICLVTGRKKTLIQEHFDHDPQLVRHLQFYGRDELLGELAYLESGIHLTFIRQSGPQGVADAVGLAQSLVGDEPFVVALGDSIISEPETGGLLRRMIDLHTHNGAAATLAVEQVPEDRIRHCAVVRPAQAVEDGDELFAVDDLVEKPEPEDAPGNWAIAARYVFSPEIFDAIQRTRPAWGGETQLADAIRILLQSGGLVQAVRLLPPQERHDIGSFDGYFRTFVDFALRDPYFGEKVREYLKEACDREPHWDTED